MADFPCLPFWTDAYLADTNHLTTEEHGAYLLLLIHAWRTHDCALPDDDLLLARHAGLSGAKWKASKPIIMAFWSLDKRRNRWVQKRLKKERGKAVEKTKKARDSAATRWNKTKSDDANASSKHSYPKPEPEPVEKATAFSLSAGAREKRGSGWISPKTPTEASDDFIRDIDHNEHGRTQDSLEASGEALRVLSATGTG